MARNPSKDIALGGVMAALAVVIMCLGGIIPVATYICPMLCALLLAAVLALTGKRIAWTWYAAVSMLSLLLGPDKEAAAVFVFLGYYPMLKALLERKCRRVLCWVCKLLAFHLALGLIVIVAWAFFPALLQADGTPWQYPLLYALSLICFILYDVALTRFITFYLFKLRRMLKLK